MILLKFIPLFITLMIIITLLILRNNLLIILLNLEILVLTLVLTNLILINIISMTNTTSILIILTLGACEASLGLACLIKISRRYGNDKINNKAIILC